MPHIEHKKSIFPYVQPTVEAADKISQKKEIIDTDFVATEQKNKRI